jgi:hypothetical protein
MWATWHGLLRIAYCDYHCCSSDLWERLFSHVSRRFNRRRRAVRGEVVSFGMVRARPPTVSISSTRVRSRDNTGIAGKIGHMTEKEAAFLLGVTREALVTLIEKGVVLPVSKDTTKLAATRIGSQYSVSDEDLNAFIGGFEADEPGRHPPADVRRELLTEAKHHCGICRQRATRLQFHHILEWEKIKHHDPAHMIAICGTCHDDCGMGKIDKKSQEIYKAGLARTQHARESSPDESRPKETAPLCSGSPEPEFHVAATTILREIPSRAWYVDEYHPGRRRIFKIDGACLFEFTNLRPVPIMISAYLITTKGADGKWSAAESLPLGSTRTGRLYLGDDLYAFQIILARRPRAIASGLAECAAIKEAA